MAYRLNCKRPRTIKLLEENIENFLIFLCAMIVYMTQKHMQEKQKIENGISSK